MTLGFRIRRRRVILGAVTSAVAVAAVSLVIVALTSSTGRPPARARVMVEPAEVTAIAEPASGPSADQLARGRWVRMPPAPIQMCDPLVLWDGQELVAVQEPSSPCSLGAAEYDPRANRWTKITAPPVRKNQSVTGASGGGRVVLVLNTGAAYSWRAATGRWQSLGSLPAGRNGFSVAWTGRTFLVTRLYHWRVRGPGEAFELASRRWKALPDLPQPARGRMVQAPATVLDGSVYVLASIQVTHPTHINGSQGYFESGYDELLRLTRTGWIRVPLGPGEPKSQLQLTQVGGAIVAAGSSCPGSCTEEDGSAALLRPGSTNSVTRLRPPPGVPYPWNFAAGARAIVVTYTAGLGILESADQRPPPGTCYIYDVSTGTWQPGPTAPAAPRIAGPAYWTSYGVVSLGQSFDGTAPALARIGGWLLRPLT